MDVNLVMISVNLLLYVLAFGGSVLIFRGLIRRNRLSFNIGFNTFFVSLLVLYFIDLFGSWEFLNAVSFFSRKLGISPSFFTSILFLILLLLKFSVERFAYFKQRELKE